MRITPAKDYKKPLYAIGLTATIMAVSVTGCANLPFGTNNKTDETEEVVLAGEADIRPDETEYCKPDADNEPVLAGEVELDGEVAIDDEVELDGDIDVDVDVTEYKKAWNDSPILDGGAPIDEN